MAGENPTTTSSTTPGAWQTQTVTPGATVGGNTTSAGATVTTNPNAVALYNMSPAERKQLALALKNAGYRVPTNGVFSDKLVLAYTTAVTSASNQAMQLGLTFNKDFFTNYLARETEAAGVGAGTGGPSKVVSSKIYNDSDAKQLIDAVIRDQLGRGASTEEIKKYTSMIQGQQKKTPTVTTYKTVGGTQTATTTGGFNAEQYLVDRISGGDEARANRALGFYEAFMTALGRG